MSTKAPYTETPNHIFELMPSLSEKALKVTLAVVRKTNGYHQPDAKMSITLFQAMTGLSRQAVTDGISEAIECGAIARTAFKNSFKYYLAPAAARDYTNEKENASSVNNLDRSRIPTSQESRPKTVKNLDRSTPKTVYNLDPLKESNKETIKETSSGASAKKPRRASKKIPNEQEEAARERRKEIKAAYLEALGHDNVNHGQVGAGAKQLEKQGYTPEQVKECYYWLKDDPFWEFKPISLQTVYKNMVDFLNFCERRLATQPAGGNYHGNGTTSTSTSQRNATSNHRSAARNSAVAERQRGLGAEIEPGSQEWRDLRADLGFD